MYSISPMKNHFARDATLLALVVLVKDKMIVWNARVETIYQSVHASPAMLNAWAARDRPAKNARAVLLQWCCLILTAQRNALKEHMRNQSKEIKRASAWIVRLNVRLAYQKASVRNAKLDTTYRMSVWIRLSARNARTTARIVSKSKAQSAWNVKKATLCLTPLAKSSANLLWMELGIMAIWSRELAKFAILHVRLVLAN